MHVTETSTILVVEDERIVAKDLQRSLTNLGYSVPATATSAEEALRLASERCPDLVLMDIRLRGERDGIETAKLLRSRFDVPVVYLTAYSDKETVARAKATEPYGYLTKPIKADELRSAVEIALHKHRMDLRLRDRERWFATTLRSIGDAVISTDVERRITLMNPVAEVLTGWRMEDAIGRPLDDVLRFVDEVSKMAIDNPIQKALQEGRIVRLDTALLPQSGGDRVVADSAAPIVDESGAVLGAVLVFRDVSEQRRLQRQLELIDRLSSVGTVAAGIAHEINNPLTLVSTNLQSAVEQVHEHQNELVNASWTKDVESALVEAQTGAQHVAKIVADLRSFARPAPDSSRVTDIRRVIESSIAIAGHEIRAKARVFTEFSGPATVLADETRLSQVFVNLLMNAAQAIASGRSEENEIRVITSADPRGRVAVEIRDTGSGMTEDVLKRAFDPFFTTKEGGHGTGLGLGICHGIVTSLGGEISAESQAGKGSTFRVVLPAAPAEAPAPPELLEEDTRGVSARILVIDDEPMIRSAFGRSLSRDHTLTTPDSARDALELLEHGARFDVILCNVMMPEPTGMDVYDQVLRIDPDQARRMIFMTGGAFDTRSIEFLACLSNLRLEKPFSGSDVRRRVRDLVRDLGLTGTRSS
jgi:two-component system, cell cycle sensor histidine kinase and response regulator CckA